MKRKVAIKSSSLPARLPVGFAILMWLLLDRLAAPGWVYGVLWTVVGLAAIQYIWCVCTTVEKDVSGFGER